MYWLIVTVLVLAIYAAVKVHGLGKAQVVLAAFIETQFKELRDATKKQEPASLPYGWFDDGFPPSGSDEEEHGPIENPTLAAAHDQFSDEMWVAEYRSLRTARERVSFIRTLRREGVWLAKDFLDVIFVDESAFVRAWAAGHITLDVKNYSDPSHPVEIRNYHAQLQSDPEPIVCAAVWSNPQCRNLPWHLIWVSEQWKAEFRKMSQLERLGLMRNPELSERYIVALLEAPSAELGISPEEHVQILRAAALNPKVIGSSRRTGRKFWMVRGDVNPPFEYFGKMWNLCLDMWIEHPDVAYVFFKYVQTTPETKLSIYQRLVDKNDDKQFSWLREEVIRSCDPIEDSKLLKLAWTDQDEKCREIAKERVGGYTRYVGVESK